MGVITILLLTVCWIAMVHGKVVELAWEIDANRQSNFPMHTPYSTKVAHAGPFKSAPWLAMNDFSMSEHAFTHMDAPYHVVRRGRHINEIPWSELHGPLVVIDITQKASEDSNAEITMDDLTKWEEDHGQIPDRAWIFMNSGWGTKWGNKQQYIGDYDDETRRYFPGFAEEVIDFLLKERPGLLGIAVDTVSCDNALNLARETNTAPVHIKLLGADKLCVENVNSNITQVPAAGAHVYMMPMRLKDGTGAPTRIMATWGEPNHHDMHMMHGGDAMVQPMMVLLGIVIVFLACMQDMQ